MNKRYLGVIAAILVVLMGIVLVADLDGLPRSAKAAATTAVTQVQTNRRQFDEARSAITKMLASDPSLYRAEAAQWQAQLMQADARLREAESSAAKLRDLQKADRRQDRDVVESTAKQLTAAPSEPVKIAQNLRTEAERWASYKRDLPKQLAAMKTAYDTLHAFDVRSAASTARKAQTDWPAKKADLENRFTTLERLKQQGEEAWTASADDRAKAAAGNTSDLDYSNLFAAGEAISEDLAEMQRGVNTLEALAGQLYVGRDKVLLELDDKEGIREKVRVVETKYADAALSNPQVSNREEWQQADSGRFNQLKKSIGMVVERKPAGKYDNEAEKNIQPPGYAYIAPPGQSNQYGHWNNGVWSWLPQYLILSQMLRTTSVPPISTYDWNDYQRTRQSGGTWYGRSGEYGRTWSGSSGGSWSDRVRSWGSGTSDKGGSTWTDSTRPRKDTWNTGGSTYDESRYKSKGSYGGSKYQSRPSGGSSSGGFGSRGYSRGGGSVSRGMSRGGRR